MATRITVAQLETPQSARFLALPKPLTKKAVGDLFKCVLLESGAKKVGQEIRVEHGTPNDNFLHSFLCYRTKSPVPFLKASKLTEIQYGFLLLIERDKYLVILHRGASGIVKPLAKSSEPVSRGKLTHAWSKDAIYQKMSTRRMTVARQELRSAAYEAEDLEAAFTPALAARSIPHSIRLATAHQGVISITPSTGRVQKSGGKANLAEIIEFVDATIAQLRNTHQSEFLSVFPEPLELADLPTAVTPSGILFDIAVLRELTTRPVDPYTIHSVNGQQVEPLVRALSTVMQLKPEKVGWQIHSDNGTVFGRLKKLTNAFSICPEAARKCVLQDPNGNKEPLDRWLRDNAAFSLSFTEPEFFYAYNKLYRRAGFEKEVQQVRRSIKEHISLDQADSEKGGPYGAGSTNFRARSIFGVLQNTIANNAEHLWCCDLGDEWADFIGVEKSTVSFYHCKGGDPTTGASDFQIVIGQALKNLARIKFRSEEVKEKLKSSRSRRHWSGTQIPLLSKSARGWDNFELEMLHAISDANASWRVAIVVTALSATQFDAEAKKTVPTPHFIQLVWLLSAFLSACRERDAQGLIICRS